MPNNSQRRIIGRESCLNQSISLRVFFRRIMANASAAKTAIHPSVWKTSGKRECGAAIISAVPRISLTAISKYKPHPCSSTDVTSFISFVGMENSSSRQHENAGSQYQHDDLRNCRERPCIHNIDPAWLRRMGRPFVFYGSIAESVAQKASAAGSGHERAFKCQYSGESFE